MRSPTHIIKTMFAAAAAAAASRRAHRPKPQDKAMTTASGLQIIDSQVGTGGVAEAGQTCVMHYNRMALRRTGRKGKKFDSSGESQRAFEFPIGQRRVIAGWDEARQHEGRRQAHADHSARTWLRRRARRRCDSAERDADVRMSNCWR